MKMVEKPNFYTANVWKTQISRRTLVKSARDITKNQTKKLSILLSDTLTTLNTTDLKRKLSKVMPCNHDNCVKWFQ